MAPFYVGGGKGGGVDLSEIADWAEEGNTDRIPNSKFPANAVDAVTETLILDSEVIADPGGSITFTAVTLTENLVADRLLSILDHLASPASNTLIISNVILGNATTYSAAPTDTDDAGVIGIKVAQGGNATVGHSTLYIARHDDADKLWIADGRTDAVTLSIWQYVITSPDLAEVGIQIYLSQGTVYDAVNHEIDYVVTNAPTAYGAGDQVYFVLPNTLDNDETGLSINDGTARTGRGLYDVDGERLSAANLEAGRYYMAFWSFVNSALAWTINEPIIATSARLSRRTATRTVTNVELKALNATAIELIPAPGAGKYIEILKTSVTVSGSDVPTINNDQPFGTPDSSAVAAQGFLTMGFHTQAQTIIPQGTASAEFSAILYFQLREWVTGTEKTDKRIKGEMELITNAALELVAAFSGQDQSAVDRWYNAASWVEFWSTANDNTMTIVVDYFIHE